MHLGIQELLVILVIVLVLFGGKKVSGLGKALGTSLREFKQEVNKSDAAETSEKRSLNPTAIRKKSRERSIEDETESTCLDGNNGSGAYVRLCFG